MALRNDTNIQSMSVSPRPHSVMLSFLPLLQKVCRAAFSAEMGRRLAWAQSLLLVSDVHLHVSLAGIGPILTLISVLFFKNTNLEIVKWSKKIISSLLSRGFPLCEAPSGKGTSKHWPTDNWASQIFRGPFIDS